uniref:uncharacterized protein LOC122607086 n=1 Tax=Erigeron canadensis TaxID=72917 RepID=UPI001CB95210|nr:uncharacterized protein LOC122607086 [Erigeron canadensis]
MMIMKRGKIVGKAFNNLLFHHHHNWAANSFHHHPHCLSSPTPSSDEYEFSCTTTPQYPLSLFSPNKQHKKKNDHGEYTTNIDMNHHDDMIINNASVIKALEMLTSTNASPALPKFGKSPTVKQLRITDSPFPLSNGEGDGYKVDEAAEKFIMRFYNDLRRQN